MNFPAGPPSPRVHGIFLFQDPLLIFCLTQNRKKALYILICHWQQVWIPISYESRPLNCPTRSFLEVYLERSKHLLSPSRPVNHAILAWCVDPYLGREDCCLLPLVFACLTTLSGLYRERRCPLPYSCDRCAMRTSGSNPFHIVTNYHSLQWRPGGEYPKKKSTGDNFVKEEGEQLFAMLFGYSFSLMYLAVEDHTCQEGSLGTQNMKQCGG